MDFIRRNKAAVGVAGLLGLVIIAVLAFGVFGVQTLFFDNEVNEAGPVFASGATSAAEEPDSAVGEPDSQPVEGTADPVETSESPVDAPTEATIETIATGTFQDSDIHAGSGDVNVLTDGNERFLRFEDNFATDNGPDLNVYLRAEDGSFVDLGDLKGNIGSQNYEIPPEVDLAVYNRIDIWCVRFGVSFADAAIA